MIYAGLDLHKSFAVITATNAQGKEMVRQKKVANNGEIVELLEGLGRPVTVALVATRGWYWLYDLLEENGMEVKLSHPLKTKAIASAKIKYITLAVVIIAGGIFVARRRTRTTNNPIKTENLS